MPGRRKKHFRSFHKVAKDGATTYTIVHRGESFDEGADPEQDDFELDSRERQLEEQHKYGIFFDDDYDYMQHLKDVQDFQKSGMEEISSSKAPQFQLREEEEDEDPVSMSGMQALEPQLQFLGDSAMQEGAGLFSTTASSSEHDPDLDPEIAAALEDDFNFDDPDNELEDNFMELANADEDGEPMTCGEGFEVGETNQKGLAFDFNRIQLEEGDANRDEEEGSDVASDEADYSDDDLEEEDEEEEADSKPRKSKVTFSSGPENDKRDLLEAMTQALIEREYSMDQIGDLDGEMFPGKVSDNRDLMEQCMADFKQYDEKMTLKDIVDSKDRVRPVLPESWYYVEDKDYSQEDPEEEKEENRQPLFTPSKPKHDAVSIVSTYSTSKNLPTTLEIPEEWKKKKKPKAEAPSEHEAMSDSTAPGLTLKELEKQMREERLADAPSTYRAKTETAEEKRARKKAVKEHKRERRAEKKQNKLAFQSEIRRQRNVVQAGEAQKRIVSFDSGN